jgi:leucyl-tRNA synthetase
VVQVNGKVRDTIELARGAAQSGIEDAARSSAAVDRWLSGASVDRVIFVPDRLINFVLRREPAG